MLTDYIPRHLPQPEYLDTKQTAAYLSLSKKCLELWRYKGGGPKYSKLAGAVRYKKSDIEKFMADRSKSNTTEG